MVRTVTLSEFVEAFSDDHENASADSWIWKELGYDLDELEWVCMGLSAKHNWVWTGETALENYLPYIGAIWTEAYLHPERWADLKLRELYAFCRPYVEEA